MVVGAGMAGTRLAQNLIEEGFSGKLCLIGEEPDAGYNRILLSPVLSGEKTFDATLLAAPEWYAKHHVELLTSSKVVAADAAKKQVTLANGQCIQASSLVFATGSTPFVIPLPGHDAKGVFSFRTRLDVELMLERVATTSGRVAVIGGGLLGLEAASALARRGAKATVVHNLDYLLQLQLNPHAAHMIQNHLEAMGVEFRLSAQTKCIRVHAGEVCGLEFENQAPLEVDAVIMAVGVRPNVALAKAAGLSVNRGVVVDAQMRTSHEGVYAIGECTEFEGALFGMVAPVYDHAKVLAAELMGDRGHFAPKALATKLKVTGVDLFSAGDVSDNPSYEVSEYFDPEAQVYRRLSFQNNALVGAILIGDVTDGGFLFELIQQKRDLRAVRDQIVYGQHFCNFEDAPA